MKKVLSLFVLLLILNTGYGQGTKPNIVYIFDPLCSWCYTFSPIMEKLKEKYRHKIDFTVVSGGLVYGSKVRPISAIAEYILAGHQDMQNMSGVSFGTPYLEIVKQGSVMLDSEKPSNAVVAFRTSQPDKSLEFSHELQRLFFRDGVNLNEDSTYRHIARTFGEKPDEFLLKMKSDSVRSQTLQDFKKVEESGISGFPTLVMRINGEVVLITNGYEKLEKIEKKIEKILKQHNG